MDILIYLSIFVVSLAVLLKASDFFVEGAEKIGLSFGISPFIIGVTIIAFGTSLPELASSIAAIYAGQSEIVIGNVVGSNITNIALVLGIVAVIGGGIYLKKNVMVTDIPILLASVALLWFTTSDQNFTIFEAILLIFGLLIFLVYSFTSDKSKDDGNRPTASWKDYLLLIGGGVGVYLSAEWTIVAISKLSELAGISPEIIALSLVALGTSLPELIVSIAAARKGKTELAVGNVLGSNIFNTYAVMGISRLFGPLLIPAEVITFSIPFMAVITVLFALGCLSKQLTKWEGWTYLLFYGFFVIELFKDFLF